MHHNLDPDECVGRMRQRVFDETKLTVSAGIAANKVGFQPFLYQLADFHRRFPDASQSMHFFRLLTEHNLTVHVLWPRYVLTKCESMSLNGVS